MLTSTRCHQKREVFKNPLWENVYQESAQVLFDRINYAQDPRTGDLEILQESHYYPFGLEHNNYDRRDIKLLEYENNEKGIDEEAEPHIPVANRGYQYKFGGMELQKEFGVNVYDFGFRNYDPAIARWMNVDPMAEKMRRHSPYNYAFNNPIFWIDPDGMVPQAHVINVDNITDASIYQSQAQHRAGGMFDDDNWYRNNETGGHEYFDGDKERDGYLNLGSETSLASSIGNFSLNEDGSFTNIDTGEHYKKGESIGTGHLNIKSNLNFKEKASRLTSNVVRPVLEVPQIIAAAVINQVNISINEGFHEGRAYDQNNVIIKNIYQFENWSFVNPRDTQSTGTPTWQEGQRMLSNTVSLTPLGISTGLGRTALGQKIIDKSAEAAVKTTIKKTIENIE